MSAYRCLSVTMLIAVAALIGLYLATIPTPLAGGEHDGATA